MNVFQAYLGSVEAGKAYCPSELIATYSGPKLPILIDVGTKDEYYHLFNLEHFEKMAAKAKYPIRVRRQRGFDHSYFFVSTFMKNHIEHHARALGLSTFWGFFILI